MQTQKAIPAVLLLALICFFLPFVSVSCQGGKLMTFSGMQLVTGTTVQEPQMFEPAKPRKIESEPLAVLAFLCGLLGLVFSLVAKNKGKTVAAVLAGLGAVALLTLKSRVENEVLKEADGLLRADFETGYWGTLLLFVGAVGARLSSGREFFRRLARAPSTGRSLGHQFCPQCGARNDASDSFCKECGAKFAE